ncbi:MAG: response regulator transcription factor [Ktedonobacterales bacterium]|nr:response regulator transcription factor [Ktedonobacterales bacterium]
MKILVADDDRDMVDLLTYWLRGYGYDIVRAFDGEQAIARWREDKPDLVILDIEMPKVDGFEVCRRMSAESNSSVLVLTCRDPEADEVRALDLGADDYLRKPFSPRQLLARIRAVTRRANATAHVSSTSVVTVGPVTLDSMRHEATRNGSKVRLTPIESRLLHLLLTHTGQVLTTDVIVERVWGYDDGGDTGLVKTHIRHLRQKIEPEANVPRYIVTVPGVGYTFMSQSANEAHA